MNKQEVIEKINGLKMAFAIKLARSEKKSLSLSSGATVVELQDVIDIVNQIDEPEKPILSKEEAEWLERLKKAKTFTNCLYVIARQGWGHDFEFYIHEEKYKLSYRDDNDEDSEQTKNRLVNALIYGYEVEKEKLYTVEIPNPHGLGHTVLVKDMYGNIFITYVMNSDWRKSKVNQLTEAEIKKDFDWAWQFAKEVKE